MSPLPILDLIAGMIFIYFLMSIICNAVFEGFSALWQVRARMLQDWIVLTFPSIFSHFLHHSLLNGLSKKGNATAYITAANFSLTLIDAVAKEIGIVPASLDDFATMLEEVKERNVDLLPDDLSRTLKQFITEARQASIMAGQTKTEFELYHAQVEKWFDSMMERVGGTYKQFASIFTFIIAFTATFALNVDSISIANYLYSSKDPREKLATVAYASPNNVGYQQQVSQIITIDTVRSKDSLGTIITHVSRTVKNIDTTSSYLGTFIPLGWNVYSEYALFEARYKGFTPYTKVVLFAVLKIFGLLITVFSVCLGAPFWFDVLGKVANLRNNIKPAEDKSKGDSKNK